MHKPIGKNQKIFKDVMAYPKGNQAKETRVDIKPARGDLC